MKAFVVLSLFALCGASPLFSPFPMSYHAQDELGQYSYGYDGGPSAKQETRTIDGVTRGGYSYLDSHGIVQSAAYVSDPLNGFRVAATNLPVGPAVPAGHHLLKRSAVWPYSVYHHGAAPLHLDGTVADTPAVTAAKLNHFAARINNAAGLNNHVAMAVAPRVHTGGAPLHLDGTVAETPEVSAAKLAHFAAKTHAVGVPLVLAPHHLYKRAVYGYPYGLATLYHGAAPLNPDGTVADTPAVAAAKAAHFAAKAHAVGAAPLVYAHPAGLIHHGAAPLHIDGTVADTPAVAVAKAHHFAAHAAALSRHRRWAPLNIDGTVADTPEVTAAKINHFAAHAAARGIVHPLLAHTGLYTHGLWY